MRIGQLARKYNIKQDEIILFLDKAKTELSPFHHNSKLSSDIEELINEHFSLVPEVTEATKEEQIEELFDEEEEQSPEVIEPKDNKKTEADLQRELDPTLPLIKNSTVTKKDGKSIDTERLLELLESEDPSNDLSNITHIKAPKKELSGLKVVGRVELAEPKSKAIEKSENQDKIPKNIAIKRPRSQQLRDEKKDNIRQKIKEQKERYEAREEKRRKEEEKKQRKAQNRARYDEKMQKVKTRQAKQQALIEVPAPVASEQPQSFTPLSIFDKFWKLFNL